MIVHYISLLTDKEHYNANSSKWKISANLRILVRRLVRQLVRRIENNLFQKKVCNPSRSSYDLGVSHNDDTIKLKFNKGLK
jgi:hypothetical protein